MHSDTDTVYVEDLGPIAQYHHWQDMLYSHGMVYFLRDYAMRQMETQIEAGVCLKELRPLIDRFNTLNSKIIAYEATQHAN